MNNKFLLFILILFPFILAGQNTFKAIVKDSQTKQVLKGATAMIQGTNIGGISDANGLVELSNVPNGSQPIVFNFLGYTSLA